MQWRHLTWGADYSLDNALQPTNAYNTTGFVNLTLKFRMYFSRFYVDNVVETGKDEFVNIEVSTNGGTTWIATPIFKYVTDIGKSRKYGQHKFESECLCQSIKSKNSEYDIKLKNGRMGWR